MSLAAWTITTMRLTRWCWVYVLVAVPFAGTIQAQSSNSRTIPTPTSSGDALSLAISMASTGSASPIPDPCSTGAGQLLVATDSKEFVLICAVDYPNSDLVACNADLIADCIQTCENFNQVYPNVGITYTPSYNNCYSCYVKCKSANAQSEAYQADTAILLQGINYFSVTSSSTTSASAAASSTSAATTDDGCLATNGTTLFFSSGQFVPLSVRPLRQPLHHHRCIQRSWSIRQVLPIRAIAVYRVLPLRAVYRALPNFKQR